VKLFLAGPELAKSRDLSATADHGHGRIEERVCRATDNIAWLKERHPDWVGLRGIAAMTSARTDKKAGTTTVETRFYITSSLPVAAAILAATRAHWSIENNLHWMLSASSWAMTFAKRERNTPLSTSPPFVNWRLACLNDIRQSYPLNENSKKASCNNDFLLSIFR
jgi:hypothetical protein